MLIEKVSLSTAVGELHGCKARTRLEMGVFKYDIKPRKRKFTVGDFYVETNFLEVEELKELLERPDVT